MSHLDSATPGQCHIGTVSHLDSVTPGQCHIGTVSHLDSVTPEQCHIGTVSHLDSVTPGHCHIRVSVVMESLNCTCSGFRNTSFHVVQITRFLPPETHSAAYMLKETLLKCYPHTVFCFWSNRIEILIFDISIARFLRFNGFETKCQFRV